MDIASPSLVQKLKSGLVPAAVDALDQTVAAAEEMGLPLFLVGGAVRDLFLKRPNIDIDLCAEGNSEELATRLATMLDARLVRHDRFGTYTVRRAGFHLDIAQSRRETYSRPGALPVVTPASITEDLARRDFTINAMALRLT